MSTQLVFVHGRAQEHKDAADLKKQWIQALQAGLTAAGLDMPLAEDDIRFPYYGQTLYDLTEGSATVGDVVVKGEDTSRQAEQEMQAAILEEIRLRKGITDEQVAEASSAGVQEKGVLNWGWVQGILEALDKVPFVSSVSIGLFTRDVYHYLRNPGARDQIESGIRKAITPGVPTVVVAHSLGTVVAYNLLKREGKANGWVTPLFVTLGCPLGVSAIRKAVAPNKYPECANTWFNAFDPRDVVALNPLTPEFFPTSPAIENKTDVDNPSENRHAIEGYLGDPDVARRIHDAVIA